MKKPVFEIIEQNSDGEMQKTYRIWADGTTEGFSENSAIINGIGPLLDYARGLLNPEDFIAETCPEALLQDTRKALRADVDALRGQRDALRRALEIIAAGYAQNPQTRAADELIALGL